MLKCLFKAQSENKSTKPKKNARISSIQQNIDKNKTNADNINSVKSDSNTNTILNTNTNSINLGVTTDDEDEAMLSSINNSNRNHYITQSTTSLVSATNTSLTITQPFNSESLSSSTMNSMNSVISRTISPSFASSKSFKSKSSSLSSSSSRRSSIRSYDIRPDNYLTPKNLNIKNVGNKRLRPPPKHRYNQIIIVHKRNKDRIIHKNNLSQSISRSHSVDLRSQSIPSIPLDLPSIPDMQSVPSASTYCTNKENICICNHESEPLCHSYQQPLHSNEDENHIKLNYNHHRHHQMQRSHSWHQHHHHHHDVAGYQHLNTDKYQHYKHHSQPHINYAYNYYEPQYDHHHHHHHHDDKYYDDNKQNGFEYNHCNKKKKYKYINVIHEDCNCCPDCIQYVVPSSTTKHHGKYQNHNKYNYYNTDLDNYNYNPNGVSSHHTYSRHINHVKHTNSNTINGLTVIQE